MPDDQLPTRVMFVSGERRCRHCNKTIRLVLMSDKSKIWLTETSMACWVDDHWTDHEPWEIAPVADRSALEAWLNA